MRSQVFAVYAEHSLSLCVFSVLGEDYALPSNTAIMMFNTTAGGTDLEECVNITVIDDDVLEGEQQFTVHTVAGLPLRLSTPAYSHVIIHDNEGALYLSMCVSSSALRHCDMYRRYDWL